MACARSIRTRCLERKRMPQRIFCLRSRRGGPNAPLYTEVPAVGSNFFTSTNGASPTIYSGFGRRPGLLTGVTSMSRVRQLLPWLCRPRLGRRSPILRLSECGQQQLFLSGTPLVEPAERALGSPVATLSTFGTKDACRRCPTTTGSTPSSAQGVIRSFPGIPATWATRTPRPSGSAGSGTPGRPTTLTSRERRGLTRGPNCPPVRRSLPPVFPSGRIRRRIRTRSAASKPKFALTDPANERVKMLTIRHDFSDKL